MRRARAAMTAALLAVAAPGFQPAGEGTAPAIRPPARLSATGLFEEGTLVIDPRNRPFVPQYPLWTDGAAKSRWIRLPEGATIDVSDIDAWRYPTGTRIWKEFSFGRRRVETRMIWKASDADWVFAAYIWNQEQTDAELAPESGIADHVEVAPGKHHSIPSIDDCAACHAAGRSPVLGFGALQLSDDRDPLAPHAEPVPQGAITLRTLVAEGRLDPPRPDLAGEPPRIRATSPRERAALGYLAANCGGCHNASGPLSRLGLVLAHELRAAEWETTVAAIASAVDAPGGYKVPGVPAEDSRLVAPGDPGRSALAYRMRSRRPSSQMPPLGTVLADQEAIRLIEAWIAEDLTSGQEVLLPAP